MGERKQMEGSFFFAQKEIPLRSNVATAPNVIPEPRGGLLLRQVSYWRWWQKPLGQVVVHRDN